MIKHSLANYPKNFLGYVISPTKICIQFAEVDTKLRFKEGGEYIKLPSTEKALPISPKGTPVEIVAVGCQMPVLEDLQNHLLNAYLQYGKLHSQIYKDVYQKEFLDFLCLMSSRLNTIIQELSKQD